MVRFAAFTSLMFADPRITQKELAQLCRRLGTALGAGIDIRKVWDREATGHGSAALKARMLRMSDEIDRGASLSEAVQATGEFFPPLFRELVGVGEITGNMAEIFTDLADHYDHQVTLRRQFLSSIAWPMFQLFAAICIIGLVIFIMGFLTGPDGKPIDIFGLGLTGFSGLVTYLCFVGCCAAGIFVLIQAMRRGMLWTRPIQRLVLRVPVFGRFLEILALSRLAWTMHLTFNTSLDLRTSLPLCLRSTHNALYIEHIEPIVNAAVSGRELCEAFTATGAFPGDFLDALEVGERSGRLPESMAHLAEQYRDQARRMMQTLAVAGGFAIGALVALIIIAVIFMMIMRNLVPYYQQLHDLTKQ